ncbi:hypothetical protein GCM10023075_15090 [Streptosporangium album]
MPLRAEPITRYAAGSTSRIRGDGTAGSIQLSKVMRRASHGGHRMTTGGGFEQLHAPLRAEKAAGPFLIGQAAVLVVSRR